VANDGKFAEVGIAHVKDPHAVHLIGAEYAAPNTARHIRTRISGFSRTDRFLVYCFRGFRVDSLPCRHSEPGGGRIRAVPVDAR
jgi:hypothetical protein